MRNIDILLQKAKDDISMYCIQECKALCCRKGNLPLFSSKEVEIITSSIPSDVKIEIIKKTNGTRLFNLENPGCPHLTKDYKCKIHKNTRPKMCKEFPIYTNGFYVIVANDCPAAENRMFDKYFDEIKKLGYTVLYN